MGSRARGLAWISQIRRIVSNFSHYPQLSPTSKYAGLSAAQVIELQARQMALWAAEDAARRDRNASILRSTP